MGGLAAAIRGDPAAAEARTAPVIGASFAPQSPHFSPASRVIDGWAWAVLAGPDPAPVDAVGVTVAGVAELDEGVTKIGLPMFRSLHGETLLRTGDPGGAVEVLQRALDDARATGEVWWEPEILRLPGRGRGPRSVRRRPRWTHCSPRRSPWPTSAARWCWPTRCPPSSGPAVDRRAALVTGARDPSCGFHGSSYQARFYVCRPQRGVDVHGEARLRFVPSGHAVLDAGCGTGARCHRSWAATASRSWGWTSTRR